MSETDQISWNATRRIDDYVNDSEIASQEASTLTPFLISIRAIYTIGWKNAIRATVHRGFER